MEPIAKFVFEAGMLKRTKRSGWWAERVDNPESVADHSLRTAILAFILAKLEGMDDSQAKRVCTAAVFHDMHEARIGDLNKITARYIKVDADLEARISTEQIDGMEQKVALGLSGITELTEEEKEVLKDADYLECAFQAKEYASVGHKGAEEWVENIGKKLKCDSARRLHAKMRGMDPNSWWKGLKKLD
ncbi:MAG: HD domain-containing protein [Candidatus Micrarchaeota archaeon]